MDKQEQPR